MPDDASDVLAFGVDRAMRTLREHAGGQNVLAVLTDSTADEWHRRWERAGGDAEQVGLIECFDLARGAAAAQTTVVSDDLAVATVERPIDASQLRSVLERFLDGWEGSPRGTVVYLESLADLREDTDRETVGGLLESLTARTDRDGVVAAASDCAARDIAVFGDTLDETVGEPSFDTDAPTAVRRLRTTDPTTFGYFRSYWREAIEILDRTDRSYVQAGQLADETELSSRMLGATLSALARLDALALRADTNGPNRYDCRNYDPERAAELGLAVESLPE
ncbi:MULTISPECIES: DUF7504 family protein [Halolamina]|uniref:Uncharacterized protein n=1 Tax=Halolamina pelagica TaxID=699431 RepID=A0A1I5V2U6_9EURY|nr:MULTISPECIES: hypothetical protein [Halolamina]NHX37873.1 hypothetical protein [Halolamina sp. R1-12]SFQ01825.1 hypothetical protein SAMN05216277_1162 [Halolamina pelagica]